MKKFIALMLLCSFVCMCGCGVSDAPTGDGGENPQVEEPQQSTPEEPKEKELTKEDPIINFVGKTVGDVKKVWGEDFVTEGYGGTNTLIYTNLGITFYVDFVNPITDDCEIVHVSSNKDIEVFDGVSGNVTFPKLQEAVAEHELAVPSKEYNMMDEVWTYTLNFKYQGCDVTCVWEDDPETTDALYILAESK